MKFLAFVGPGSTGKTTLTGKLAHHFINLGYKEYLSDEISDNRPSYGLKSPGTDFYVVLEKDGKYVLFHTPSDTKEVIKRLQKFLEFLNKKGIEISLVVMSCRDASDHLYDFTFRILNLTKDNPIQIPLGRMVRGEKRRKVAMDHYISSMFDLVTTRILPQILQESNL